MKRKRGRRPGKKSAAAPASASPAESPSSPSTEEASTPEDQAEEDAPAAAAPAVPEPAPPPPPVSPPSQPPPQRPPSAHADITYTKPKVGAVYGRVKLKFKKPPAPQQQLSALAPPADSAKPGTSAVPEAVKEAAAEKVTAVATDGQQADVKASDMSSGSSDKEKVVRKVGIKIKAAGLSSSSTAVAAAIDNSTSDGKPNAEDDKKADAPPPSNLENISENKETEDTEELRSSQESEKKQSTPEQRRRDDKELAAALEAIKKVMKMDAAEPFNTPVDPVALGIPDYFDIIDTPMDFGTICQNLEHGNKYMNSEDVYRDVQFIWDNCTKYNSKGDYVVELMKRVKKGFMKHWLAAGLYSDAQESGGNDNTGDEDAKKSKSKNKRRRPGNDRHKNDCACAVCQVTRRKKEKDEMAAIDNEITMMDSNTLDQHNLEGNSGANHPGSHDTSSQEQPTQADMYKEAAEANDSDIQMEDRPSTLLHSGGEDEGSRQYSDRKEGIEYIDRNQEENTPSKPYEYSGAEHHQKEQMESSPEVEMEDYPVQQENPSFTKLCASLFPRVRRYAFRGRHSLFRPQRRVPLKEGPLHAAIAAIMKP